MTVKLRRYKKSYEYGYSFGVFPTIEMMESIPEQVVEVIIHSKGSLNRGVQEIIKLCEQQSIITRISDVTIERISQKNNIFAVGVFRKYNRLLTPQKNHVVLVNPSDSGNLGTIMRTMLGFEIQNLGIIVPAVDYFDPKVIRASMGSVFKLNIDTYHSIQEYLDESQNTIYPFMVNGNHRLDEVAYQEPFTLVFGNESRGLDDSYLRIGESVFINHSKEIDSLNLAISVGIALHETMNEKHTDYN